jgi:ABC-type uncharacterized transport system auxiliary subunit
MKWMMVSLLVSVLAGCGSFAPPHKDYFYRLPDDPASDAPSVGEGTIVYVPPFVASGLHGERALIYAHDDGTSLEQYTYHYWVDSPRVLLQQALAQRLRAGSTRRVVTSPSADAKYTVRAYIGKFERRGKKNGWAEVSLEFEVTQADSDTAEFARAYRRSIALPDEAMTSCAAALGAAAQDIVANFVTDLEAHWGR